MGYQTQIPLEIACSPTSNVSVALQTPDKKIITVLQFSKADGKSYFRFTPKSIGKYVYSDNGVEKSFLVKQYSGGNRLYENGGIVTSKDTTYLTYENGKPFFWLADTWWYGATNRMGWPKPFQKIVADRKKKGFTVVQIVVGIPPEIDAFSKDSENSGGGPFQKDWSLNPAYFDEVDGKIAYLVEQGIVPCIVGGWGHHIDWMGGEHMKLFWRELIARYAAYPVVFCLSGEIDIHLGVTLLNTFGMTRIQRKTKETLSFLPLPVFTFLKTIKHAFMAQAVGTNQSALLQKRMDKWKRIGAYIAEIDSFHRPITAHVSQRKTARELLGNPLWLTIDNIQSGHSQDSLPFMVTTISENKSHCIINMEPWYEGILGNFGAYHQRMAFWLCVLSGAKAHSYGAHGLWQMAEKYDGFMAHWGKAFWQEALTYKGADEVGIGRKILEQYSWEKLESDLLLITPHWNSQNIDGAVSARIGNDTVFVYLPKKGQNVSLQLILPSPANYTVKVIHPGNGKLIKTFSAQKRCELPSIKDYDDMLYIAEKA